MDICLERRRTCHYENTGDDNSFPRQHWIESKQWSASGPDPGGVTSSLPVSSSIREAWYYAQPTI